MARSFCRRSSARAAAFVAAAATLALAGPLAAQQPAVDPTAPKDRVAPPALAARLGLMPLQSTGVVSFRTAYPTYDGRGVVIGILDSGIDPAVPGLTTTTTGEPKVLDLRDFSGEGRIALTRVTPQGDAVTIAGKTLRGFGTVRAASAAGPYWAGVLRERALGPLPASDLDGDGTDDGVLPVLVARAQDGWVVLIDHDGDGSFEGEKPVHDFLVARETFGWARHGASPLTLAANIGQGETPTLDLFFDTSAHGTHVAGIAAGHDIYGVASFNGVAPGAWLLGLKIADDANGGLTTTTSMRRALAYAIEFARARKLPLVLNMSFGVGNADEGKARIDAIVDSVLAAHPDVVFAISAGNDGPGLSTMGFPGSASRAITIGATFPAVFRPGASGPGAQQEPIASFSARGAELAKPDIVTPGVAYSTVPPWNIGDEIKGGTSMASPHAAGLAALLVSGLVQQGLPVDAARVRQALVASARHVPGAGTLDEGAGRPDVVRAMAWLGEKHEVAPVGVALESGTGVTASWRPAGFRAPGDTLDVFRLERLAGAPRRVVRLTSDQPWFTAPDSLVLDGTTTKVTVALHPAALTAPGVYTGTVTAYDADTAAGPAFNLVSTVAVPLPRTAVAETRLTAPVNTPVRLAIPIDSGRAADIRVRALGTTRDVTLALHEPDGMPYREDPSRPLATGDTGTTYAIDARDAVGGDYELVALAGDAGEASVQVVVRQAPVAMAVQRGAGAGAFTIALANRGADAAEITPTLMAIGAERTLPVMGASSAPVRVPLTLPAWVKSLTIDVAMDRAQWNRFTDFGMTLFDSAGRQLGKEPLNYPAGRLRVDLPEHKGALPATLGLFPGFADAGDERWALTLTIRYYADSAVHATRGASAADAPVAVPAGGSAAVAFKLPAVTWPLPQGFLPLGAAVIENVEGIWTQELALPAASAPAARPRPKPRVRSAPR